MTPLAPSQFRSLRSQKHASSWAGGGNQSSWRKPRPRYWDNMQTTHTAFSQYWDTHMHFWSDWDSETPCRRSRFTFDYLGNAASKIRVLFFKTAFGPDYHRHQSEVQGRHRRICVRQPRSAHQIHPHLGESGSVNTQTTKTWEESLMRAKALKSSNFCQIQNEFIQQGSLNFRFIPVCFLNTSQVRGHHLPIFSLPPSQAFFSSTA